MVFFKYIGFLFLLSDTSSAQMLTKPRIIAGQFDRWYLERSLREYLEIPYSTVYIKSLHPQGFVHLDNTTAMLVRSLVRQVIEENGDNLPGIVANWINPIVNSMSFTHYTANIVIHMPNDLDIHLSCQLTDFSKHKKIYFNRCKGAIFQSDIQRHPNTNAEEASINARDLLKYLPELCRKNCFDKDFKLPLVDFLDVRNNMPWNEKPFIDYSEYEKASGDEESAIRQELFYLRNREDRENLDGDLYTYVHSYLNHGIHVGLMPREPIPLPGKNEALLLVENSTISLVDSSYKSDEAHCLIVDTAIGLDNPKKKAFWKKDQLYFLSAVLFNEVPSHLFHQQYMLISPMRDVILSMTCHNSPLLSLGEFLKILGDKLVFIDLPR